MHNYAYFRISVEKIWTSLWIETLVPQTYFYAWLSLSRRGQCRSNSGTKRRHNNAKKKQSLGGAESLKVAGSDNIHNLCCRSVYADKDLKYLKNLLSERSNSVCEAFYSVLYARATGVVALEETYNKVNLN